MELNPTKITYLYKRTTDPKYWEGYLSRKLTNEEKFMLCSVKQEKMLNDDIVKIYERAKIDGLYIPALTKLDGNCLFDSFEILELCEDSKTFRIGIAQLLLIMKNIPNFLPGFSESIGEIFPHFTEIDKVRCKKTGKVYLYNYDAMCVDLSKDTTYTRLNTEMLMRTICVILNLNIVIYHPNGNVTNINENPNENTLNIYLGQVGDSTQKNENGFHYVPLKIAESNIEFPKCLMYMEDLTDYHKWARAMAKSLGKISIDK